MRFFKKEPTMVEKENKKGLSTIVATLLIILLTLVAVGIIWIVVRNVIQGGAEQISLGRFTLDLEISQVQRINDSALNVVIRRNVGKGDFVGIAFIVEDGINTETIKQNVSMNEFDIKSFQLYLSTINASRIRKISIAPIFKLKSGKEVAGDVKDEFKVASLGVNGVFEEEEEEGCGNGICDNAETCSNCSADCGVCLTCGDGICNSAETCANCSGDCGVCGEMIYLVQDGVGLADIVVSSTAPNMTKLAAKYFQMYIYNMTGVNLSKSNTPNPSFDFHVYIGKSSYTDALGITDAGCRDGGFKMISGEDYLVLLGDDNPLFVAGPHGGPSQPNHATLYAQWDALTYPSKWANDYIDYYGNLYNWEKGVWEADKRGSMNAVYEFLYNQGIRWYHPGWYEHPGLGIIIPEKENINFQEINKTINPDLALRDFMLYGKGFRYTSYQYDGQIEEEFQWLLSLRTNTYYEYMIGTLGGPGHGIRAVISRLETEAEHPEYYAILGTVRMNESNPVPDLCSQELFEENVRYIKAMYDIYNVSMVSVMPSDGFSHASNSSAECLSRETPERGNDGLLSDYVWEYVNNVAWEIYDDPVYRGKINISGSAYTTYSLPPEHLSKPFAPNIIVGIARWRGDFINEETKEHYQNLANQWYEILPSHQITSYDYYLYNYVGMVTQSVPVYFPHLIDEDLKFMNGKSGGEFIEISTNSVSPPYNQTSKTWNIEWDAFAVASLNTYITARLYWDVNQNVNELLNEYYELFYGPAKEEMKSFIEYSETHYDDLSPAVLATMRNMLYDARVAAGDNIYGYRIDLVIGLINSNYEGEEILIDSCQTLSSSTSTYKLTSDVFSTGTCFIFEADGLNLDCQGHTITYSTSGGANQNGIYIDEYELGNKGDYFGIRNCIIKDGNYASTNLERYGIFLHYADMGIIENTTINSSSAGLKIANSFDNLFKGNTIMSNRNAAIDMYGTWGDYGIGNEFKNNFLSSDSNTGLSLYNSNNTILINNTLYSRTNRGLWVGTGSYNCSYINNTFTSDSSYGVQMEGKNSNFISNKIISNSNRGLMITGSGNKFEYNTITSNSNEGIHIEGQNNTFISNTAKSNTLEGIRIQNSDNKFINQTAIGGTYGISIWGGVNNSIKDCFYILGNSYDIYIGFYPGANNNSFVNCSYNSEYVGSGNGEIIRKWYLDYYVTGSSGISANVSSYNSLGALEQTSLTNYSGRARQELTEYINSGTKLYRTPHIVNVVKSGYTTNTTSYNLTTRHNIFSTITLI